MSIGGSQLSSKNASLFTRFARWSSRAAGTPFAFVAAVAVVIVWGVTGPLFGFSDTWQLVINTGTTIVTFLMVSPFRLRRTATPRQFRSSSTS